MNGGGALCFLVLSCVLCGRMPLEKRKKGEREERVSHVYTCTKIDQNFVNYQLKKMTVFDVIVDRRSIFEDQSLRINQSVVY